MENKNKLQQTIKHIKTMFYNLIVRKVKSGYKYYYYLCFKDFFRKLLKPKKMVAIKWKGIYDYEFKYITHVNENQIKKCSYNFPNGIYSDNNTISFLIQNNNRSIRLDELELIPPQNFIIIENGYIFYKDDNMNSVLYYANPRKLKSNNDEWIDFDYSKWINEKSVSFIDIENLVFLYEQDKLNPNRWKLSDDDDIVKLREIDYKLFIKEMSNPLLKIE